MKFNLAKEEIRFDGNKTINAISHKAPLSKGTHKIQIPDFPHGYGNPYLGDSPYSQSWFFIGEGEAVLGQNDKYLHPGTRSLGCATCNPEQ